MNPCFLHVIRIAWAMTVLTLILPSARGDTIGFFYALDADLQGLKTQAQY